MTRDRWKVVAIGVGLAVVLGAALYLGGRWQERGLAAAGRAVLMEDLAAAQAELARAEVQLARAENRIRLLRARSLLFETALDLERRNFGTANQHLNAAAEQLGAVRSTGPEVDSQALQALQSRIAGTDLNVATNLEAQRRQVLEFIARLDELTPEGPTLAPAAAPA